MRQTHLGMINAMEHENCYNMSHVRYGIWSCCSHTPVQSHQLNSSNFRLVIAKLALAQVILIFLAEVDISEHLSKHVYPNVVRMFPRYSRKFPRLKKWIWLNSIEICARFWHTGLQPHVFWPFGRRSVDQEKWAGRESEETRKIPAPFEKCILPKRGKLRYWVISAMPPAIFPKNMFYWNHIFFEALRVTQVYMLHGGCSKFWFRGCGFGFTALVLPGCNTSQL